MKKINLSPNRLTRFYSLPLLTLTLFALLLATTAIAYQAPNADVGYVDFSYGLTTANDPTGEKPESKLWWNDGFWWGSLFETTSNSYHIYRFNWSGQTWEDTGVQLDDRPTTKADTLWDQANQKLYVASHVSKDPATVSGDPNDAGRLYRYSYNKTTRTYTLDNGFPVTVNVDKTETLVMTKDATGRLWVTYVSKDSGNSAVFVNASNGGTLADDAIWGTPFVVPFAESVVSSDDISSITAFSNNGTPSVAVAWSNQATATTHIAIHPDASAPNSAWTHFQVNVPGGSDDHISLNSLQTANGGQLFAVVKTNGLALTDSGIGVVARDTNGVFSYHSYSRVTDKDTRPILVIDNEKKELYVFVTNKAGGDFICYKKATITTPLSNMSFTPGDCGTPFIANALLPSIDNASSTKQLVNSNTGIVVLGSDQDNGQMYVHNVLGDPSPVVMETSPATGATDIAQTSTISMTFSKPMNQATLNNSTIIVTDQLGKISSGSVAYDGGTNTAVFTPTTPLSGSSLYTVALTSGIKDSNGKPLNEGFETGVIREQWTFSTTGPTISLDSAIYQIYEDDPNGAVAVTVALSGPTSQDVTVDFATADGTAVSGTDYTGIPTTTITIPAGEPSAVVNVPLINDNIIEADKSFTVSISNVNHAIPMAPTSATVTILDDDALPTVQFGAANYNVDETESSVTVEIIANPISASDMLVDVVNSGGTATNGVDYSFTDIKPLTITNGTALITVTVPLTDDQLAEGDETIELMLQNLQGASDPRPGEVVTTTIHILDDEPVPTVALTSDTATASEADGTVTFTATLSSASAGTVTVDYASSDGTATADEDYTPISGTLTFDPGQMSKTFEVTLLDDALDEADETAVVTLSNPVAADLGTPASAALTISDNDDMPTVAFDVADYSVDEDAGTALVVISLDTPSGQPIMLDIASADGTAVDGADYVGVSKTITLTAGTINQAFAVTLNDDDSDEANETFTLTLSNADHAVIGDPDTTTITILDNDEPPTVSFKVADYSVHEGAGEAIVVVSVSVPSGLPITVDINSADGTAVAGSDYTAVSQTITIDPGTLVQTFTVTLLDDGDTEDDETFTLTMSNATNATVGDTDTTTVTIRDDDGTQYIYLPIIRRQP